MFRKLALTLAFLAGIGASAGESVALELGLTPSNVFSLWTNVNDALLATARISSGEADWAAELAAMKPRQFAGKKPADVLGQAFAFRDKLDRLRDRGGLGPTKRIGEGDGAEITPSVVFLNSGHVLDGLVLWIIHNSGKEQLVSQFYTLHDVSGKTPSDVFGLVELATRRIDRLLTQAGA